MNQILNFPGNAAIANWLTCIVHIVLITGAFAIGISWLKHYLASSDSARILGKLVGILIGVGIAIIQTHVFIRHFDNLNDETISLILITFMIVNAFVCIQLFASPKPPPTGGAIV